jgi:hypothetical protein
MNLFGCSQNTQLFIQYKLPPAEEGKVEEEINMTRS